MNTWSLLRKQHPTFTYKNFTWQLKSNSLEIKYDFFTAPDLTFTHKLKIFFPKPVTSVLPKTAIDNLVFHIGLVESFSYWKATCSPVIAIKPMSLNSAQTTWWHKLLTRGMGEYFYKNQIEFTSADFVKLENLSDKIFTPIQLKLEDKYLLLTSGGKDSAVAAEILTQTKKSITPVCINPTADTEKMLHLAKLTDMVKIIRVIDPKLIALSKQGYLNGHVPFSATLAFLSLLVSSLTSVKNIVVGNEKSANEANVIYLGKHINHQYSKSQEFENDFKTYVHSYISPDINYFSLLRPLFDLQIAKLFSKYPQYFSIFKSCNKTNTSGNWCTKCGKCLSTFILLAPFITIGKMNKIMGTDLLSNQSLLPLFKSLLGLEISKPFECVATYEEIKIASFLLYQNLRNKQQTQPILIRFFQEFVMDKETAWENRTQKLLTQWDNTYNIPVDLATRLKQML